jgi:hypothetical protein
LAQEFVIKSQAIEDKVNQLLPSQGGFQAGVDFSASTMVVPIIDLTETATGSQLRQDLQSALSLGSQTAFEVFNQTSTIINTTGYFRIVGGISINSDTSSTQSVKINLTDGTTTKIVYQYISVGGGQTNMMDFDKIIFLQAGDSCTITATNLARFDGSTRQLADLSGNLVSPI